MGLRETRLLRRMFSYARRPNGRRYFLYISQKVLASENVFGYTVRIPTGRRHSTLWRPPAKDKEEYPLWLAVRQCGDLS